MGVITFISCAGSEFEGFISDLVEIDLACLGGREGVLGNDGFSGVSERSPCVSSEGLH